MNVDRFVMLLAGTLVLFATLMTVFVSSWWAILAGFVALNLMQASFTGVCPAAMMFKKAGVAPGAAFK